MDVFCYDKKIYISKKNLMIYVVLLSALFETVLICVKLQPIIAQFNSVIFAFRQKKEKKTYNNHVKR